MGAGFARSLRRCLSCGRLFDSSCAGDRVCSKCWKPWRARQRCVCSDRVVPTTPDMERHMRGVSHVQALIASGVLPPEALAQESVPADADPLLGVDDSKAYDEIRSRPEEFEYEGDPVEEIVAELHREKAGKRVGRKCEVVHVETIEKRPRGKTRGTGDFPF